VFIYRKVIFPKVQPLTILAIETFMQMLVCGNVMFICYYSSNNSFNYVTLAYASTVNGCSDAFTRIDKQ